MGGTLGRCGSPRVENIYDFFPRLQTYLKQPVKNTKTFLKLRADQKELFTANG